MSKKIKMYLVYSTYTGKIIDMVPHGVMCFKYPIPDGETNWTTKEKWPEICATNGWKP